MLNCPGMGSVSYAMPGELLSPEDKVSICSHFYLFIESKDNSLQRQLGSILLSVWGCWVLQEYWRWQRDQEQLLYLLFMIHYLLFMILNWYCRSVEGEKGKSCNHTIFFCTWQIVISAHSFSDMLNLLHELFSKHSQVWLGPDGTYKIYVWLNAKRVIDPAFTYFPPMIKIWSWF